MEILESSLFDLQTILEQNLQREKRVLSEGYFQGGRFIKDLVCYRVFIPSACQEYVSLEMGVLVSAMVPDPSDWTELQTVQDVYETALDLVQENKAVSIDEVWRSYQNCLSRPNLIQYVPMSPEEAREFFRRY